MKHLIAELVHTLEKQTRSDQGCLVRLDYLPSPEAYLRVCKQLEVRCRGKFVAKLSRERCEEFCKSYPNDPSLEEMMKKDWVDTEGRMTYYRNITAELDTTIVLMGTEAVEDRGGLADFHAVSPQTIEAALKGKYSKWAYEILDSPNDPCIGEIDEFIAELFRHVPADLAKLSTVFEDIAAQHRRLRAQELVKALAERLHKDWGLPRISEYKTFKQLLGLLKRSAAFRDRLGYKDGVSESELRRLQAKFERFVEREQNKESWLETMRSISNHFSNFDAFEKAVINYLCGYDIDRLRLRLFKFDFAVINRILGISIREDSVGVPPSYLTVRGNPLEAFLSALLHVKKRHNGKNEELSAISFELQSATVADCTTMEELHSAWTRICVATGGVLDFIKEGISTDSIHLSWLDNTDPFLPSDADQCITKEIVKLAAAGKRLTTITVKANAQLTDGAVDNHEVRWEFPTASPWTIALLAITDGKLNPESLKHYGLTNALPFCYSERVRELVEISTEGEFVAALSDCDIGVKDLLSSLRQELPDEQEILNYAETVSNYFHKFVDDVLRSGFFNAIARPDSSGLKVNRAFKDLLRHLCETRKSSRVQQKLNPLVNSFLIAPPEEVESIGLSCALVPPFHPAMLEKIQDQAQFVRDGALELVDRLQDSKIRVEAEIHRLFELSTITSGLDVIPSKQHPQCLRAANTFAYHSLYRTEARGEVIFSTITDKSLDILAEDQSSRANMRRESPLSRLITDQLNQYLSVFPWHHDELTLVFFNPPDLQPVVTAVSVFVDELKKSFIDDVVATARINLHIFVESLAKGGRGYLRFWLDDLLNEDDPIELRVYCTTFTSHNLPNPNYLDELLPVADVAFVHDFLTNEAVVFMPFEKMPRPIAEKRFPMVYPPLPRSKTSVERQLVISQPQFEIAHQHTQLIHKILYPNARDGDYRAVIRTRLKTEWSKLIEKLHERSQWVVAIDSGIDRELIQKYFSNIISFATGDGPFGELNHAVTCSDRVLDQIRERLTKKLRSIFTKWSSEELEEAVEFCLANKDKLDGLQMIRALSPDSMNQYQLNDLLAYILTAQAFGLFKDQSSEYAISTLICLDNYRHWFPPRNKRPDLLLLQVQRPTVDDASPKTSGLLRIHATLIECKMGGESDEQINDAIDQLVDGFGRLSSVFDPNRQSIDRRYWYSQLYRALAFSPIDISDDCPEYEPFVAALDQVMNGEFEIEWRCALYTYWLNQASHCAIEDIPPVSGVRITQHSFGCEQIKQLLQPSYSPERMVEPAIEPLQTAKALVKPEETSISERVSPISDVQMVNGHLSDPADQAAETHVSRIMDRPAKSPVIMEPVAQQRFTRDISNARALVGRVLETGEEVHWEYGHRDLPNRHLLISGSSGTGKTYLMQCLMLELARQGISSVVFDYTDGFTKTKLEPEFREFLEDNIVEFPVYTNPFPLNPFKRHEVLVAGQLQPQKTVDVADRIKSVFQAVYSFGDQQASAIYQATRNGLEKYDDTMTLRRLREELHALSSDIPNAKTVLSKIEPMVDREPFDSSAEYDWDMIRSSRGKVFIVQLSGLTRDVQLIITEMVLWDAWYYNLKHGDQNTPFPVILDEAQNLDHRQGSPSTMILTEGRKFGWSGWFATQFLKKQLSQDQIQRLQQASTKIYFCPPEAEIADVASMIDPDKAARDNWRIRLSRLRKGECVVSGFSLDRDLKLVRRAPRVVRVTPLKDRIAQQGEQL